jgi:hypothetical protein
MSRHTPGPWIGFNNGFKIWVRSEGNLTIAPQYIADLSGQSDKEKAWADAQLMAAAPDLLEALKELVDLVEGVRDGSYKPDSFTCQPALAAIAKAEGK